MATKRAVINIRPIFWACHVCSLSSGIPAACRSRNEQRSIVHRPHKHCVGSFFLPVHLCAPWRGNTRHHQREHHRRNRTFSSINKLRLDPAQFVYISKPVSHSPSFDNFPFAKDQDAAQSQLFSTPRSVAIMGKRKKSSRKPQGPRKVQIPPCPRRCHVS